MLNEKELLLRGWDIGLEKLLIIVILVDLHIIFSWQSIKKRVMSILLSLKQMLLIAILRIKSLHKDSFLSFPCF